MRVQTGRAGRIDGILAPVSEPILNGTAGTRRLSQVVPSPSALPRRDLRRKLAQYVFACLLVVGVQPVPASGAARPELVVTGVDGVLLDNVLAHLQIDDETCAAPSWRVRRLYREADNDVEAALQAYGFYSAQVKKEFVQTGDCWSVRLEIEPGDPVVVRAVDVRIVDGEAMPDVFRRLVDHVPLESGRPLNHSDYETYKGRFTAIADRYGYFDGRFVTSRIDVYPDELAADITLEYDTGTRYRFGAVTIEQDVVHPKLAEGYIDFETGQPYDSKRITKLYEALLATGYFYGVDIRTTPEGAPVYEVAVVLRMNAAKPRSYTGGVGYGTDTGIKLRAEFLHRKLNKLGHQLEINGNWSKVKADAGASYRLPLHDPRNNWLMFDTGYRYEDNATSTSETWKVGTRMFRKQSENWLRTYFLDYGYEKWDVGLEEGRSRLLVPGISWEHSLESGPPRPLKGVKANMSIMGAAEQVLSDTSFLQLHAYGKFVHRLWPGGRALGRAELGYTLKSDFDDLPATIRFFTGGDVSVRGYEYKSLGSTDAAGFVVGGTHLAVFSYEVDQLVRKNWSVAAFVDAGNAFNDFNDIDLAVGVGVGVRWYSLLGPIRVDFAVPLAADAPDNFRIHITLGPDL